MLKAVRAERRWKNKLDRINKIYKIIINYMLSVIHML